MTSVRTIPSDAIIEAQVVARRLSVAPALHSEDNILWYLLAHRQFERPQQAVTYYFENGLASAARVQELADQNFRKSLLQHLIHRPISILDFASGFGCVTRHLPALFPNARIAACDIHPPAADFIREKIGVEAILSNRVPEQLSIPAQSFDIVFALSFFSHLPNATWGRWLQVLCSRLTRNGILIFTTNGMKSFPLFGPEAKLDDDGFYFLKQSEQGDLDPNEYGSTITSYDYVSRQIDASKARLLVYKEGIWYGHQDVYVLRRSRRSVRLATSA